MMRGKVLLVSARDADDDRDTQRELLSYGPQVGKVDVVKSAEEGIRTIQDEEHAAVITSLSFAGKPLMEGIEVINAAVKKGVDIIFLHTTQLHLLKDVPLPASVTVISGLESIGMSLWERLRGIED
jgi:hypothetical protein